MLSILTMSSGFSGAALVARIGIFYSVRRILFLKYHIASIYCRDGEWPVGL